MIVTRAQAHLERMEQEISFQTQSAQWKLSAPHTREQECGDKLTPHLLIITETEMKTTEPKKKTTVTITDVLCS